MVVVSETKESQLLALLEQCVHLDADVRPRTEKGFFTVTVPPPWNGSARRAAQAIQDQIKEWSKQYRMWCVTALTVTVHWFMCCKTMWQRHGMGIGLFRAFL